MDAKNVLYPERMSNDLLAALSILLGRTVTRDEIGTLLNLSARSVTRRAQELSDLRFGEIRDLTDKLDVPIVQFLVAVGLLTQTEVAHAVDGVDPLLSEATSVELAERLLDVLRDDAEQPTLA